MPRMSLCPITKGCSIIRKITKPLFQSTHTKGGIQLQSLGMHVPAPVAHFLPFAISAAQSIVPVQVPSSQYNNGKRKVSGKESVGGSPTGCRFPWRSGVSALLCGCKDKEETTEMRALSNVGARFWGRAEAMGWPCWHPGQGPTLPRPLHLCGVVPVTQNFR